MVAAGCEPGLRIFAIRLSARGANPVFRKIVTAVIVIPLAVVILAFAVANRQIVTVSFDPFSSANPAYSVPLPLFVLIFVLVILGVIIGGAAAWVRQSPWRRTARRLDADVRALHDELTALRHDREQGPRYPASRADDLPAIPPPTP